MAVVNRGLGEDVYITSGVVHTAMDVDRNFGTGNQMTRIRRREAAWLRNRVGPSAGTRIKVILRDRDPSGTWSRMGILNMCWGTA